MKIVILIHKNFEWIRTTIKRASHELMIMMKNKQSFRSVKSLENILKYFISFEWEKKKKCLLTRLYSRPRIPFYLIQLTFTTIVARKSRILEQRGGSLRGEWKRQEEEETSTNFSRANDS